MKRREPIILSESADEAIRKFVIKLWQTKSRAIAPRVSTLCLEMVLKRLHDSEINAGLQSFFDSGLRVWIGDPLNGIRTSSAVGMDDEAWGAEGSIARWLHETALSLYPESHYACAFRR